MTRQKPRAVRADAARGWLYLLDMPWAIKLTALTLGHVIVGCRERLFGPAGKLTLAHELAHTRQHHWLGPLYLPAHMLPSCCSRRPSRSSSRHFSRQVLTPLQLAEYTLPLLDAVNAKLPPERHAKPAEVGALFRKLAHQAW